jgi:hypothetical protein
MRDPLHFGPYTKHINVQFIWIQPHCYNKNVSMNTQTNNSVLPVLINLVYTSPLAHARAHTHTHKHVHPPTLWYKETSSLWDFVFNDCELKNTNIDFNTWTCIFLLFAAGWSWFKKRQGSFDVGVTAIHFWKHSEESSKLCLWSHFWLNVILPISLITAYWTRITKCIPGADLRKYISFMSNICLLFWYMKCFL